MLIYEEISKQSNCGRYRKKIFDFEHFSSQIREKEKKWFLILLIISGSLVFGEKYIELKNIIEICSFL
jgi:hypothetical protein